MAAISLAGFDEVVGRRRGVQVGDLLSLNPTDIDRAELERMCGPVDRGQLAEALEFLASHRAELMDRNGNLTKRFTLVAQLHERVASQLAKAAKRHHLSQSLAALKALGFEPDIEHGRLLSDHRLQDILDSELTQQASRRCLNLLKAGMDVTERAADAAYEDAFVKTAGAQCFQNRERLCQWLLDGPVPPNLTDVSAWRHVVKTLYDSPSLGESREGVARVLRGAKSQQRRSAPTPRRRQRYLH